VLNYKTYSDTKDSGVEWLGEIPMNWGRYKLKYVLSNRMPSMRLALRHSIITSVMVTKSTQTKAMSRITVSHHIALVLM